MTNMEKFFRTLDASIDRDAEPALCEDCGKEAGPQNAGRNRAHNGAYVAALPARSGTNNHPSSDGEGRRSNERRTGRAREASTDDRGERMSITYQVNGRPVTPAEYARVTTGLLDEALTFRRNIERWFEVVGKTPEKDLDPFRMWIQLDDLIHRPELAERVIALASKASNDDEGAA